VDEKMRAVMEQVRPLMSGGNAESVNMFDFQKQYGEAVVTLEKFGFSTKNNPSLEQVKAVFSGKEEAIASLKDPVLVLQDKSVSFREKIAALDKSKLTRMETYVNENFFNAGNSAESEREEGFQAWLIEGVKEMNNASSDDLDETLGERIPSNRRHRSPDVQGMDRERYALLMMDALRKGEPIDQQTWTILDEDKALLGNLVPNAVWNRHGRVGFGRLLADRPWWRTRFRSSVGGDVIA
jgi:hypothetical protein